MRNHDARLRKLEERAGERVRGRALDPIIARQRLVNVAHGLRRFGFALPDFDLSGPIPMDYYPQPTGDAAVDRAAAQEWTFGMLGIIVERTGEADGIGLTTA